MKFLAYKKGKNLIITDEFLEDFIKLENGFYYIELKHCRNPGHHRKFFAILKAWADLRGLDLVQALLVLKYLVGWTQTVEYMGKQLEIPKSISFAEADQVEFNDFYSKAMLLISRDFKCSVEELERSSEL